MRQLFSVIIFLFFSRASFAGGPEYVAGASYFDPAVMGTSVAWSQGAVTYFTDQGDLSSVLPGAKADSFVASAFALWSATPTAALAITRGGQLAEDVNGTNVTLINGVLSMPSDIQPAAVNTPVGIVYDQDGSVTDALLGAGAGNSAFCAANSVFGGIDNLGTEAQFLHALIVLNGNCAASSAQLPDLQYHLARVIGRVLGLDWSQANLNVIAGNPSPTAQDYAGFPVMHEIDPPGCVPVADCYSSGGTVNPAQPKMDDQAALSRLYPVKLENAGSFPQQQVFSQATARIHGSIYFSGSSGGAGQPMQGVNVVARWIDPVSGQPSRAYVATSISGFLFCGNAGNPVTGFSDSNGQNFNQFGSSDQTVEGFFDLAGLQIPSGSSGQYQITVEAVDPLWSENAGPYGSTSQVAPSGSTVPIMVAVALGGDTEQDITMQGSASDSPQWYGSTTFAAPAQAPLSGNWAGALSSYGASDYFQFSAQANRTLSVIVDALDESGMPSTSKLLPVVGMWALSDPGESPAPAATPSAFNTPILGESRLDAQILQSGVFRMGISDFRGDGRPDYLYNARVFYADNIFPARASAAGGTPLTIAGFGLQANTTVQAATVTESVLAASATQLLVEAPAVRDGVYDVQLGDALSGGSSLMKSALTVGAGPKDTLMMISGANPAVPVGGTAPAPFKVIAVATDGVTPVAGASVSLSSNPAVAFSACSGASRCTVLTDESGTVSTTLTVLSAGVMTLSASLAPASYSQPSRVEATLLGTESLLDLSLLSPSVWTAPGASAVIPIAAMVLSKGNPLAGQTVNYQIVQGAGTLSAPSAPTNSAGTAAVILQLSSGSMGATVTACVAPNNSPCRTFNATTVAASSLQLQPVAGTLQVSAPGQTLQPVMVRVMDSASPPHPVLGASVFFQAFVGRVPQNQPIVWSGEAGVSQPAIPVILAQPQATAQSDVNGMASFPLSTGGISGGVAIVGSASVGNASLQFAAEQLGP